MRSGGSASLAFAMLALMLAPSAGDQGFLAGDRPLTGMVVKSIQKEITQDSVKRAESRMQKAEKAYRDQKLAVRREREFENRTEKTLQYLEGKLKVAHKSLKAAKAELKHKQSKIKKHHAA